MIFLLAAAAALTGLPKADEDDLRCLAYLSVAAGKVDGDQRRKVDGGALYYFGRIESRSPQLDIGAQLEKILHAPGYGPETYQADKARCHGQLDPLATRFDAWRGRYEGGE
ncbi:hypothetical protein [Novosphingobium sp. P6W]|uniref:hypothetical protein n=1 Tax=Novosphingobium sp. P6W TaxID=1609758 RepID=UPI0005C2C764|nr:hypothetical protein [Novosphingobium sp. P6W]AXB75184.1 hypothetical protein TQ38_000615 [Novosphingobium sp. P6W]KIS32758.1 hypothetical protein TQ38_10800 [Novosphingobium sp. P6W]